MTKLRIRPARNTSHRINDALSAILVSLCIAITAGCSMLPTPEPAPWTIPLPEVNHPPAESGSLYRPGASLVLFDDRKAGRVGDLLTVLLVESIDASKKSSTSTQKASDVTASTPTIFGQPLTAGGVPILDGSLASSNGFSGSGESQQSNSLDGSVSVTVVGRQPNGNLLIQGRKQIDLNQGSEFVSIAGVVRPEDITTANTINSDRIAHAQITYSGKGPVHDANRMGFIMRFFNSPWSLN